LYLKRRQNQILLRCDSLEGVNIFAIFDGMGGESNGSLAAKIAAEILCKYQREKFTDNTDQWSAIVDEYIHETNEKVCEMIDKTQRNMGSTMALIITNGYHVKAYNLGDSRTYFYSQGQIKRLSVDHTVAAQLAVAGLISEEEVIDHPYRNRLTRHLGMGEFDIKPHVNEINIKDGDILTICSDGLTDMCNDTMILSMLNEKSCNENIAGKLVESALALGGHDNVTVITIKA